MSNSKHEEVLKQLSNIKCYVSYALDKQELSYYTHKIMLSVCEGLDLFLTSPRSTEEEFTTGMLLLDKYLRNELVLLIISTEEIATVVVDGINNLLEYTDKINLTYN